MASIKTSDKFETILKDTLEYGFLEFGATASIRFYKKYQVIQKRLSVHPLSSPKEPLLKKFQRSYRSAIIRKNWKIIYRYDKDYDRIVFIDLWDMRKNPKTLIRQFKRKL